MTRSAHHEAAKKHVSFTTVEEMNNHVLEHIKSVKMNHTEKYILTILAQHSLKYPGVSWIKVKNIAAHVQKSERMTNYALSALEKKNVIKRIPVMRDKTGGNSSNLIVILQAAMSGRSDFRPSFSERAPSENSDIPMVLELDLDKESFSFKKRFKQDNKIYKCEDLLYKLFQHIWKDKQVCYGSAYMNKVVEALIKEYEKIEFAKRQLEKRRQSKRIQVPDYDWLNEIDYTNFEERTSWLC
ncbi:hypothetical protein [Alteribacillus sp. YIM 98480]|uniref:hypothetical protein n=1 Tax=Alteribacillus sp. YIM 98480 TaxID=2606599 RepID=UPI00131E641F|nr:hypothetical protein [Alteribacillus sp. YIM 98480]